jgi:hypothetical protein
MTRLLVEEWCPQGLSRFSLYKLALQRKARPLPTNPHQLSLTESPFFMCYYSLLLSLSGLFPYVKLCLISRCRSLRYPILASLMVLAVVLRTLLPLRGKFTPLQTNLSPYKVCASTVRPTTSQSIAPLLNYWLILSCSEFIIWLCDLIRSL